jgi:hypothetical protein
VQAVKRMNARVYVIALSVISINIAQPLNLAIDMIELNNDNAKWQLGHGDLNVKVGFLW